MPWSHLEALQAEARSVAAALGHDGEAEHTGNHMGTAQVCQSFHGKADGRTWTRPDRVGVVSKRSGGLAGPGQLGRIMSLPGRLRGRIHGGMYLHIYQGLASWNSFHCTRKRPSCVQIYPPGDHATDSYTQQHMGGHLGSKACPSSDVFCLRLYRHARAAWHTGEKPHVYGSMGSGCQQCLIHGPEAMWPMEGEEL